MGGGALWRANMQEPPPFLVVFHCVWDHYPIARGKGVLLPYARLFTIGTKIKRTQTP